MAISSDPSSTVLKPVSGHRRLGSVRAISALVLREMSTTYGRSPGGYIWALLEPVLAIALLTAIFSTGFRTPGLGTSFAIFYATGILPFLMFIQVSAKVAQSVQYSRQLLVYPGVTYIDAIFARFLLNFTTQLLVFFIVVPMILSVQDTRTTFVLPEILLAFAMCAALVMGVGVMNAYLNFRFELWSTVWGVITRPLVLLSGVIFLYDSIPSPYREILWYNPLVHIVGMMRKAFYHSYDAAYVSPLYVFLLSGVLLMMGLIFLRHSYRDLLTR